MEAIITNMSLGKQQIFEKYLYKIEDLNENS